MSSAQRVAAIAVAVLSVIGACVVALHLVGRTAIGMPSAPVATPLPSTPSADVKTPAPSANAGLGAVLAAIEEQVIAIRGLPAAEVGAPQIITRAELADELARIFDEEYPREDRERDTIAFRALGLLGPDDDVAELQLRLLGDQVLGFYDDVDRRMVVVSDAGLSPEARMTYAHEYTHALQDAAFDLASLDIDEPGEDDRALARTALVEGDASVVMLAWAFANLTQAELLEVGLGATMPDVTGIPSWMVAQVNFPYDQGLSWASALVGNPLDEPDFGDIDAAFAEPPDSTEQIIHLAKWRSREAPIPVAATELAQALGTGWRAIETTTIGEAFLGMILEYQGVPRADARVAASGWGGDRASIASGPDGAFAVTWRLAWDTPADADEFADAYASIVDSLGFPATVEPLANGEVLVLHASSDDVLRAARDSAGG
ncbi:MAG: hypothetical protein IT341_01415 [Chloroflexi bacterium]|nr:hypothetical protein [Chloroflexota bacterium]